MVLSQDDDSFFGADAKTSTRFDRNFSITDFLKINLGTEVALPLVSDPDSTAELKWVTSWWLLRRLARRSVRLRMPHALCLLGFLVHQGYSFGTIDVEFEC